LSLEDGEKLVSAMKAGETKSTFRLSFSKALGEQIADFSSRGPVMDTWMINPDISAPGVNIVSTITTQDTNNPYGFGSKHGTI
ncbi:S8 family serine peptidase, partial [Bacillus vallismortis]|nr:S8 family serine peptidase [Bacillus vallismortis]